VIFQHRHDLALRLAQADGAQDVVMLAAVVPKARSVNLRPRINEPRPPKPHRQIGHAVQAVVVRDNAFGVVRPYAWFERGQTIRHRARATCDDGDHDGKFWFVLSGRWYWTRHRYSILERLSPGPARNPTHSPRT